MAKMCRFQLRIWSTALSSGSSGNARAAKLSGINVDRTVFIFFAIMGLLSGLAGALLASRLNTAVVLAGQGVGLVHNLPGAAEVVEAIVREARIVLTALPRRARTA